MIRLPQAIASVIGCTLAAGAVGGVAGSVVGKLAPSFVRFLATSPHAVIENFNPAEFGLGFGAVCGFFMGAAASVFLVSVLALRDAWLAHQGISGVRDRALANTHD